MAPKSGSLLPAGACARGEPKAGPACEARCLLRRSSRFGCEGWIGERRKVGKDHERGKCYERAA